MIVRTLSRNVAGDSGAVRVEGWIHRRRRLSNVTFVIIRDRTGLCQVVVTDADTRSFVDSLGEETVVRVDGTATPNAQAPQGTEVTEPSITVLSGVAETPPAELWKPSLGLSLPALLDHAPVSLRHPSRRAVLAITAASVAGFREALASEGFTEIHTPKIVGGSTESGADVFELDYFGRPAYLAQSPQFYKQVMVGVLERVYEVGPVFRAEQHDTVRHLAEYVSLDAELGFIESHRDIVRVLRTAIGAMVDSVRASAEDAPFELELPRVPDEFPIVPFREALAIAGADPDEPDLAPEHERRIGAWALERRDSEFVVVEGYPMVKRPFYTHPQPDAPQWSNSFDLLFRGQELVTGGQRLHVYATMRPRWPPVASRPPRTRRTCRRSSTGCHRTVASRSGWRAGSHDSPVRRTSARPRCSPGIFIGCRRDAGRTVGAIAHRAAMPVER